MRGKFDDTDGGDGADKAVTETPDVNAKQAAKDDPDRCFVRDDEDSQDLPASTQGPSPSRKKNPRGSTLFVHAEENIQSGSNQLPLATCFMGIYHGRHFSGRLVGRHSYRMRSAGITKLKTSVEPFLLI